MFEIQRDVPVPTAARGGRPSIYPFRDMAVGDSFAVPAPGGPADIAKTAERLYFAVQYARRKDRELHFTVRRQADHVGVWRTA